MMSYYDCHYDLVIRVEDPNGIQLNERMTEMMDELNTAIRKVHPAAVVLPRGFKIAEERK